VSGLRFSAVVGQEQAKQALLLVASRPLLAGVLLRGEKGSAKTTLARGLAALLPGDAPFVELPLGATEERVIGSLDLAELLTNGQPRFRPGLLAAAHGGVLYVDEINLLADHLVDALLDVAVSGQNRVERDGLSHVHPARFVLVASMNPEEGELRPQLLDRFGLAVDVRAPADVAARTAAVRRQLAIERRGVSGEDEFAASDDRLRRQLRAAQETSVELPDAVINVAARLAVEVGAEGLRADLMLCRAATAVAAFDGRLVATHDDVRAVAEMVLGHRRRRRPFDEPGITPDELDRAWREANVSDDESAEAMADQHDDPAGPTRVDLRDPRTTAGSNRASGGFGTNSAPRGRFVREEAYDPALAGSIDARGTAMALAARRATSGTPAAPLVADDFRGAERAQRVGTTIIFVVDASGSMGVEHRMAATKAAVLGLLGDAYRRRGRVALVTFRGEGAEVVLRPTASVEIARARLTELSTGGASPLAAGIDAARAMVDGSQGNDALEHTVVIVTDGRATGQQPDPIAAADVAMRRLAATGARVVVLDTETDHVRLAHAVQLAEAVGAEYMHLDAIHEGVLEDAVRSLHGARHRDDP
jgi:magnesium chelatase subunit D